MRACELSIPGKTFLAGEYLALIGGPAILISTEPKFRLLIKEGAKEETGASAIPFHPQSPAGKYYSFHQDFFENYQIEFVDPYQTGGFGASSAQFALLHTFYNLKDKVFSDAEKFFDWHLLLTDYREFAIHEGRSPSGADIVGAASGGVTWFHREVGHLQTFAWPFQDLEFFIALTGKKIATHEHLANLDDRNLASLASSFPEFLRSFQSIDSKLLVQSIKIWREALIEKGFCSETTAEILKRLDSNEEILAAKGCGAMGADVVLVVCEIGQSSSVRKYLKSMNLNVIADSSQIAPGLEIKSREVELNL